MSRKKRKRDKEEDVVEESAGEPAMKKIKLDDDQEVEKYFRTYTGMYSVSDMMNGGRRERKLGTYDSLEKANKAANEYYDGLKNDPSLVRMYGKDHWGDEMIEESRTGYPMNKFIICGIGSSSHMVYVDEAHAKSMKVGDLRKALEKRSLNTKGKKNELVVRLEKDIARQKNKRKK